MINNVKSSFIRKRGNNYNVIVEYENDEGKIKQKTMGKHATKKDAEKQLIEIKNDINKQKFTIPSEKTLVDRCYEYIEDNKNRFSPNTVRNYSSATIVIGKFFGNTKLRNVTAYQVQKFSNYLIDKYAYNTAIRNFKFLGTVLNECYRLREIPERIFDFVKNPKNMKNEKPKTSFYSIEEANMLISKLNGHPIELPMLLMMLCGLRCGEAGGLRWSDIDFEKNTISVNQIYIYMGKDDHVFKKPKTEGSVRTISMPHILVSKIKKEEKRQKILKLQGIENTHNLVCLNTRNTPWKETILNRAAIKFFKDNNLRRIKLHDLRHTHASLLLAAKVPPKAIQARLGHSKLNITMDTYSHLMEDSDKITTELLEDLMQI